MEETVIPEWQNYRKLSRMFDFWSIFAKLNHINSKKKEMSVSLDALTSEPQRGNSGGRDPEETG